MSPCRNCDSPTPSPASECAPPPEPKEGHTRMRVRGWGSHNSDDQKKAYHSAYSLFSGIRATARRSAPAQSADKTAYR
jgi:hypothetical protein